MTAEDVVSPEDEAAIFALVQEGKVDDASARLTAFFRDAFPDSDEDTARLLAAAWMFARRFRSLLTRKAGDA